MQPFFASVIHEHALRAALALLLSLPWQIPAHALECTGLLPYEGAPAPPPLPRPGYLETIFDPVHGTRITRISGDAGTPIPNLDGATWGTVERHHYSLDQAWNADMSLLTLEKGDGDHPDLYLDGRTYEVVFARKAPGARRWHPADPSLRVYVDDDEIGTWNVRTDEVNVVARFPGYSDFEFGPNKGNLSNDGTRLAVHGRDPQGGWVAFAYDLEARRKYPDVALPSDRTWATISPLGKHLAVKHRGVDTTQVFDLDGNEVGHWLEYGRPSHADLTVDADGEEVAVGRSKSDPDKWMTIKRRLRDGRVTVLSEAGFSHTSARNLRRPGWVYGSNREEIVAVKLDGSGMLQRLAHARSVDEGYLSETHASPSPDGLKIVFASNWNEPGEIHAYVVDIARKCIPAPPTILP